MIASEASIKAVRTMVRLRDASEKLQAERELADLCHKILKRSDDSVLNVKASQILERLRREAKAA